MTSTSETMVVKDHPTAPAAAGATKPTGTPRPRRPNYAKIHSKPLPLEIHPLPAFIPHNPLSLLRIAYTLLQALVRPPSSHLDDICTGIFSPETSSIHIADPKHVRTLWEMGFFGKGTLSRSEPSWLDREKARVIAGPGGTSEEATNKRREDRRLFKLERARAEREQIDRQLQQERARMKSEKVSDDESQSLSHVFPWMNAVADDAGRLEELVKHDSMQSTPARPSKGDSAMHTDRELQIPLQDAPAEATRPPPAEDMPIVDQEHLQLTPEEALFLSWGLGALKVRSGPGPNASNLSASDQLRTYLAHSTFPVTADMPITSDNQFLLNYTVYHHFRSLGWVVRPGSKFSTDYLLYVRGPVFSHAEFAVMIIPEYPAGHPMTDRRRDWWWLHCVNRVQTQVRKSLVLVYVRLPPDEDVRRVVEQGDIAGVFRLYSVREFVLKRWSANRSRD